MNKAEPLCDLRYIKAEYALAKGTDGSSENRFLIRMLPSGSSPHVFTVSEKNGDQFAAELDVLAAVIRARVMRARVDGEETN
jgi:hypothetical protein